jgi:hypothetical protein
VYRRAKSFIHHVTFTKKRSPEDGDEGCCDNVESSEGERGTFATVVVGLEGESPVGGVGRIASLGLMGLLATAKGRLPFAVGGERSLGESASLDAPSPRLIGGDGVGTPLLFEGGAVKSASIGVTLWAVGSEGG